MWMLRKIFGPLVGTGCVVGFAYIAAKYTFNKVNVKLDTQYNYSKGISDLKNTHNLSDEYVYSYIRVFFADGTECVVHGKDTFEQLKKSKQVSRAHLTTRYGTVEDINYGDTITKKTYILNIHIKHT